MSSLTSSRQSKKVVTFDTKIKKTSPIDELKGKLSFSELDNKLMHSVLENDRKKIDEAKIISESINQGFGSFTPELIMEKLVKNYSLAKNIYGEKIIRLLSGYDPSYVKRNINIPEFRKKLLEEMEKKVDGLREDGLLEEDNSVSEKGLELASLVLYIEELDNITPKSILGEKKHKKGFVYGDKEDIRMFRHSDRYRNIAIKSSLKLAIRRGHKKLERADLKVFERKALGKISIIYAIDASSSMRGEKIELTKKAGIALSFKAIEEKNKVGLIVFGSDIRTEIRPTDNLTILVKTITGIRALRQTNISAGIKKVSEMFEGKDGKHLILLTDALPTVGKKPEQETLEAASLAASNSITISLIGINLDEQGKELAKKIVSIGNGRFYVVKDLKELDRIVLEDYYSVL